MTFFNEVNKDVSAGGIETGATGPRVGFMESFETGFKEQVKGSAAYGIENEMWRKENAQFMALKNAGIEDVPLLNPDGQGFATRNLPGPVAGAESYLDVARFYSDGGDPADAQKFQEHDSRIEELRVKFPQLNLKTSREMWDEVKAEAQDAENKFMNDRTTVPGSIGTFLGGAVGALNPNSDPLNFITTPVGSFGKSVLSRIAGQGAGQGFVEGINQLTGVQEQRRLLGLNYGLGEGISRVVGAAVGGAVLQGAGEGIIAAGRKWFIGTKNDPAPAAPVPENRPLPDTRDVPPEVIPTDENVAAAKLTRNPDSVSNYIHEQSPLSVTREGRARTAIDMDYVSQTLDDWSGGRPWEIPPKTDTALTQNVSSDFNVPDIQGVAERAQLDSIARKVDPSTFSKYDHATARRDVYRLRISELKGEILTAKLAKLDVRIDELSAKAEGQSGRRAAKTRKDILSVEEQKAELIVKSNDSDDVKRMRALVMREDEKMRDLAPLVSRAYARAQQKWNNTEADRLSIRKMMREGKSTLEPSVDEPNFKYRAPSQPVDEAPILKRAGNAETKPGTVGVDEAIAVVAKETKVKEQALDAFSSRLDDIINSKKGTELDIPGSDTKLNLDRDKIWVPHEDGTGGREVSIRDLIKDTKRSQDELEAVSLCSPRKTS